MKYLFLIVFEIIIIQHKLISNELTTDLNCAIKISGLIKYFSPYNKLYNDETSKHYLLDYIKEKPQSIIKFSNDFFNEYLDSTFYISQNNVQPNWILDYPVDVIFNDYTSFDIATNEYLSSRGNFENQTLDTVIITYNKNVQPKIQINSLSENIKSQIDTTNNIIRIRYFLNGIATFTLRNETLTLGLPKNRYFVKNIGDNTYILPNLEYHNSINIDTICFNNCTLFIDRKISIKKYNDIKYKLYNDNILNSNTNNILLFSEVWNQINHFYYKANKDKHWNNIALRYFDDSLFNKNQNYTINYLNNSLKKYHDAHNHIFELNNFKFISDIIKLNRKIYLRDNILQLDKYYELISLIKNNTFFTNDSLLKLSIYSLKDEILNLRERDKVRLIVKKNGELDTIFTDFISYSQGFLNAKYISKKLSEETLYLNFCDIYSLPDYSSIKYSKYKNYIIDLRGHVNNPLYILKIIGNSDTLYSPKFRGFRILHPNFINFKEDTLQWNIDPDTLYSNNKRIYLLTNNMTYSASETTCSLLKKNIKHCMIIGKKTLGSNGDVDFVKISDNITLAYTTNEVIYSINTDKNNRICPDYEIPDSYILQNISNDPFIEFVLNKIINRDND